MVLGFQANESGGRIFNINLLAQLLQSCYNWFENVFFRALGLLTEVQVCIPVCLTSREQLSGLFANLKSILINTLYKFYFISIQDFALVYIVNNWFFIPENTINTNLLYKV